MFFKSDSINSTDLGQGISRKILATGASLMTVEVSFEKGAIGTVHTHPHEQACYVLKGSVEVDINGEKSILKQGDTFYVEPNVPHGVVALEELKLLDIFTPIREDFLK